MTKTDNKLIRAITNEATNLAQAIKQNQEAESIIRQAESQVAEVIFNNYLKYSKNKQTIPKNKRLSVSAVRDWTLNNNLPNNNESLCLIMQILENDSLSAVPMVAKMQTNIF